MQKQAKCKECGGPLRPHKKYGRCEECTRQKQRENKAANRHAYINIGQEFVHIQQMRAECGLPPLKLTQRDCLCCGAEFTSNGAHNRMCPDCADKSLGMAGGIQKWSGQLAAV